MKSNDPKKNYIIGGVVFYNPSEEEIKISLKNSSLFDKFIIVWNSRKLDISNLKNEFNVVKTIKELENNLNLGIAGGLNKLMNYAFSRDIEYVLCLDQDSQIVTDKRQLSECFDLLKGFSNFPCVGFQREKSFPKYNQSKNKNNYIIPKINKTSILNYSFMHSGCIYSTKLWKKLRGFRKDFFIEGTDTEYCLKAKKEGFDLYTFNINLMNHDSGIEKNIYISSKISLKLGYHPPWRIYLQYRNNIYLILKYFSTNFYWSLKALFLNFSIKIFQVFITEKKKGILLLAITAGIFDGIISIMFDHENMKSFFYDLILKKNIKKDIPKFNRYI